MRIVSPGALLIFIASASHALAVDSDLKSEEIYSAWLQMYDLKFQEAHRALEARETTGKVLLIP